MVGACLNKIRRWAFNFYVFVVLYATLLYFLCALLFRDSINEYTGYRDYFLSRRKWFFSLFALAQEFDLVNTLSKGHGHLQMLSLEYMLQAPIYISRSLIAMCTRDRYLQIVFVAANLVYQSSFVARQSQITRRRP